MVRGQRARLGSETDWLHRAVTEWTEMESGESRTLRAPIGGYLLVRTGEVRVEGPHARSTTLNGPAKEAVGGGQLRVEAQSDAEIALGSVKTYVGVVIDVDGGYQSDLWDVLGTNAAKRPRADYRQR